MSRPEMEKGCCYWLVMVMPLCVWWMLALTNFVFLTDAWISASICSSCWATVLWKGSLVLIESGGSGLAAFALVPMDVALADASVEVVVDVDVVSLWSI